MSKPTSIVDINGQRYDAITGQLVGAMKKAAAQVKKPSVGFNLDGFMKRPNQAKSHVKRSVANIKRSPERSKTLMRSVVKKPTTKIEKTNSVKSRSLAPDYAKAFRAKVTPKNDKVRKFGLLSYKVRPTINSDIKKQPPTKTRTQIVAGTIVAPSAVALSEASSHQQLERLLDYALHRADAHKQMLKHSTRKPWHKIKHPHKWQHLVIAFLLLGSVSGFIIWKEVPAVPLKVAASRAHIEASLPSYTPAGYNFAGHIDVKAGAVTIPYKDSSNIQKSYTVTQKASNMDSASLANTVLPKDTPTQTIDNGGHTPVFGYSDNKNNVATCVSGGVQTIVSGDIDTSSAQKVAGSLCQ